MQYNFRQSTSAKGHKSDELLSALQKYIRRGELQKAIYVGIELELFETLDEAKPLVTNAANRLRVSMVEETAGLTSPALSRVFDSHYGVFNTFRGSKIPEEVNTRRAAFLSMVRLLVEAPKMRLISDIKMVYFTPQAKAFALCGVDPELRGLYEGKTYAIDEQVMAAHYSLLRGDDEAVLGRISKGLIAGIKHKSDEGFYWLHQLVLFTQNGGVAARRELAPGSRKGSKNPMLLMLEICFEYARLRERLWDYEADLPPQEWTDKLKATLRIAADYYDHFGLKQTEAPSHRDWPVFVIWPYLLCVRNFDWDHNPPRAVHANSSLIYTSGEAEQIYRQHEQDDPMPLDDYVYDQHTQRGRSLKRKADFFAQVGALVTNPDNTLLVPAYRKLYEQFKSAQAAGILGPVEEEDAKEEGPKKRGRKQPN